MQLLQLWRDATRPYWPDALDYRAVCALVRQLEPHDGNLADDIMDLCHHILAQRYFQVAPSLPSWEDAFAAEHPDLNC
jgi:hypothetical protein